MNIGDAIAIFMLLAIFFTIGTVVGSLIGAVFECRIICDDHWQVHCIWFWEQRRYERDGFQISRSWKVYPIWLCWLTAVEFVAASITPTATRIVGESHLTSGPAPEVAS